MLNEAFLACWVKNWSLLYMDTKMIMMIIDEEMELRQTIHAASQHIEQDERDDDDKE